MGKVEDDKPSIWANFLQEVRDHGCNQISQRRSIILLGHPGAGKSSLIARLQGVAEVKRGCGIEFYYLDVKEEGRNEHLKLNVWASDGNPQLSHLLSCSGALTEKNFANCLAVICVSLDQPWALLDSLEDLVQTLENYVNHLKISTSDMDEYRESLVRHFRNYMDPDLLPSNAANTIPLAMTMSISAHANLNQLEASLGPSSLLSSSANNTTNNSGRQAENPLHPSVFMTGHNGAVGNHDLSEEEDIPSSRMSDDVASRSAETKSPHVDAFHSNLGIPIVVVVTKVDCMAQLKKEANLTDEHFDFIQLKLRCFCLKYGAGLIYTSVHEDKNCDILNRYLRHRVFGFPFQHSAYVVEADSVFVPTGWDSSRKISILQSNLINFHPQAQFNEVLPKSLFPFANPRPLGGVPPSSHSSNQAEISAVDEQLLLSRMAAALSAAAATSTPATVGAPINGGLVGSTTAPRISGEHAGAVVAGVGVVGGAGGDVAGSRATLLKKGSSLAAGSGPGSAAAVAAASNAASAANLGSNVAVSNERVLTSFFNSLLTRQRNPAASTSPMSASEQPSTAGSTPEPGAE